MLSKASQVELKESPKIAQSTRTGIRIIGTEETNLPAIDYNNIGCDSVHKKDGTTIVNAAFVDVDSVDGFISSSYAIGLESIEGYSDEQYFTVEKDNFTQENRALDLTSIHVFGMSKQHEYDDSSIITQTAYKLNEDSPEITYIGGTTLTVKVNLNEECSFPVIPIVCQVNMMNLEASKGDCIASKFIPYYNFVMPVILPFGIGDAVGGANNAISVIPSVNANVQNGYSIIRFSSYHAGSNTKCLIDPQVDISESLITDGYTTSGLLYHKLKRFPCARGTFTLTFNVSSLSAFTSNNTLNGVHSVCNGQETVCLTLASVHAHNTNGSLTEISSDVIENLLIKYPHRMRALAYGEAYTSFSYKKVATFVDVDLVLISKFGQEQTTRDYCFGVMIDGKISHPYNYSSVFENCDSGVLVTSAKQVRRISVSGSYEFIIECVSGHQTKTVCVTANTLGNINPIMYGDLDAFSNHYVCENVIVNDESLSSTVDTGFSFDPVPEGVSDYRKVMLVLNQHSPQSSSSRPISGIYIKRHPKFNAWKNGILKRTFMYAGGESYPHVQKVKTIAMSCGRQSPLFIPELISVAHGEAIGIATEYINATIIPVVIPITVISRNTDVSITLQLCNHYGSSSQDQQMALDILENCYIMGGSYFQIDEVQYTNFFTNLRDAVLGNVCSNVRHDDAIAFCGSLTLYQTHSTNSAGSPTSVQFAESVNEAEFITGSARYSTESMEYRGKTILSTNNGAYTPSILYKMSGTFNTTIKDIPRNMKRYHAVSMYLLASGNGYTSVYASDEISTVCIGTVLGDCVSKPMSTSTDVVFVTISGTKAIVYSLFNGKVKRIKTIKTKNDISLVRLVMISDIGSCLVVYANNEESKTIRTFSISNGNVIYRGEIGNIEYATYIDSDEITSIYINEFENGMRILVRGDDHDGVISSSQYLFPKFDGMTMLLAGLTITTLDSTTFKLSISSPTTTLKEVTVSESKSQHTIRLDNAVPLAYATYSISRLTGTIIDIKWIVYPVPLVSESI